MPKAYLIDVNIELFSPNPVIDWSRGDVFFMETSQDESFTFENARDGRTIILTVKNTDVSARTMSFPIDALVESVFSAEVGAGLETVYTLIKSNGKIYISSLADLS